MPILYGYTKSAILVAECSALGKTECDLRQHFVSRISFRFPQQLTYNSSDFPAVSNAVCRRNSGGWNGLVRSITASIIVSTSYQYFADRHTTGVIQKNNCLAENYFFRWCKGLISGGDRTLIMLQCFRYTVIPPKQSDCLIYWQPDPTGITVIPIFRIILE